MKDFKTHSFLQLLDKKEINYHYEGKWLIIDGNSNGNVYLQAYLQEFEITSLPDYIKFNNDGWVNLANNHFKSLPDHIEFNNASSVALSRNNLISLPEVKFNNGGVIYLQNNPLESLPDNIEEFFDKLDFITKKEITKKFPDHWFFEKDRFGL